ncbi:ribonuclease kappa-B [Schistocerca americana]|uniref:ribonuclease kappa-B n=1 Tax=Schistocerca americana TaxID=7009 RepID=UPI001F4F713B|nr:ribonuclease kappa-B [Schistocerca americana]XP_047117726.1 ribonuclease kappa-B [Schistocerca piceifrons]XP_049787203.1 ribonuclease kappa-B [Schistocerca cancellata]XP_049816006.1 ribonuclease kappa-B [Schistocerca nitens]XP_049830834.1 ribonuclease kappa-B-like [Schistocerca gregaria]XP_049848395.1 ribonuclease kappa-B-like [Schistocerca gregaria]XP_049962854.1 ribonuclease kappa-B [Schistocerca serialis cubense]
MKFCGPKLSLCGLIISVWGIIQLVLMGIFYYVRSVALADDLPGVEKEFENLSEFYAAADAGYLQNAYNCWIAACLYIFTLLISGHQFYVNSRSSLSM